MESLPFPGGGRVPPNAMESLPVGPGRPNSGTFSAVPSYQGYLTSEYGRPTKLLQSASFFTNAAAEGFPRGSGPPSVPSSPSRPATVLASPPRNATADAGAGSGSNMLIVNVDTALDLVPADGFGAHYYCATAHYVGEPEEEQRRRYTQVVKANASSTDQKKENCVLHKRISVPYNSRQQFVMVDILDGTDQLDTEGTFIGQATLPLADPRLASTAPWPLIRDGVQTGVVTLNVQIPSSSEPPPLQRPYMGSAPASPPHGRSRNVAPASPMAMSSSYGAPAPAQPSSTAPSQRAPFASAYGPAPPNTYNESFGAAPLVGSGSWSALGMHGGLEPAASLPGQLPTGPSMYTGGMMPTSSFPAAAPSAALPDPYRWNGPTQNMGNLNPTVSFPAVAPLPMAASFPAVAPSASRPGPRVSFDNNAAMAMEPPFFPGTAPMAMEPPFFPGTAPSSWESPPKLDMQPFSGGLNTDFFSGALSRDRGGSYIAPPLPNLLQSLGGGYGGGSYIAPPFGAAGGSSSSNFAPSAFSYLGASGGSKSWTPLPDYSLANAPVPSSFLPAPRPDFSLARHDFSAARTDFGSAGGSGFGSGFGGGLTAPGGLGGLGAPGGFGGGFGSSAARGFSGQFFNSPSGQHSSLSAAPNSYMPNVVGSAMAPTLAPSSQYIGSNMMGAAGGQSYAAPSWGPTRNAGGGGGGYMQQMASSPMKQGQMGSYAMQGGLTPTRY